MPVGQQLVSIEGKAGSPSIRLIQVHTLITGHDELGVLGGVCQGRAQQCTAMRVQLELGILLGGQGVALSRGEEIDVKVANTRLNVSILRACQPKTYVDFL